MLEVPFALAFTAGMVATVNPCGFAMLPAYLAWFVGGEDDAGTSGSRVVRALVVSALVTLTFVAVFGVAGVAITAGALVVIDLLPWLAMMIGVGVAALGVAMLRGRRLNVALPQPSAGLRGRGGRGVVLFGFSYAVASLSCTLPVFLAVVAGTLTTADLPSGAATFVAYGLGMGLVLMAVAVAVALTQGGLVRRLRAAGSVIDRAAALLLVVAGVYITGYWAFTLAVPPGTRDRPGWARAVEAPIELVDGLSAWAVNTVQAWALPIALSMALVVVAAFWHARLTSGDSDASDG